MPIINNVQALGNALLQRPLSGALGRMNSQNMGFYQQQTMLPQMAQEERMRQENDGLINAGQNRKRGKLKEKALQNPLANMQSAMPGQSAVRGATGSMSPPSLGGIYG
jgi:hypothetical protein